MNRVWRFLRSPRLALGVLAFLGVYCGATAWFPWQKPGSSGPPDWAAALHLDRPFSSPLFLASAGLLFLSTLVCTSDRTVRVVSLSRGRVRPYGFPVPASPGADFAAYCRAEGFRGAGPVRSRFHLALWGGWVLHVGLLSLMAGVLVQQGFHDGGAFELGEGEMLRLDAPGAVFGRDRGPFAPAAPPAISVALAAFDPALHQRGYAPDRASVLRVERAGSAPVEGPLDRAEGLDAHGVTLYQAIPFGLAVNLEIEGLGGRSLHLREETHRRVSGSFTSPGGRPLRLVLETERPYDDPAGTGRLTLTAQTEAGPLDLAPGTAFAFGEARARVVSVARWGGFTYARSPGMPAVFAGFGLVLLGALLMTFPAGVALVASPGSEAAGWVYLTRGKEAFLAGWASRGSAGRESETGVGT